MSQPKRIAIIGAGMSGIACARTLQKAGHQVTVFEKTAQAGGRMTSLHTPFGAFDCGAQYFTARDARFVRALQTATATFKPWSANTVRVLDAEGRIAQSDLPAQEPHWVATPSMDALLRHWIAPLVADGQVEFLTQVVALERDVLHTKRWQLRTQGAQGAQHVYSGFDAVLLATTSGASQHLLLQCALEPGFQKHLAQVEVAPCWALMLAFPQANQPNLTSLGPQWNAARSTHHRIAWLARESSKPQRSSIERWTVQASVTWSQEHLEDDPERVRAKLVKAFAEVTGIRAQPSFSEVKRWVAAQTLKPVGQSHLWNPASGLGLCGDYLLGCRVEDAFVSGLELALAVA